MNKKKEDLVGFKELIEDKEFQKETHRINLSKSRGSGHELLTFLEHDNKRLVNLINFAEDRAYNVKNFSSSAKKIAQASSYRDQQLEQLLDILCEERNFFVENIGEIFNKHLGGY